MYCAYYRLSDEPFRVTPDPEFLFLADQYKEALAAIVYGIARRKGFVCITGEVGTGKTTILRSYLKSVEDQGLTFIYVFNPKVSFAVLMRTVLRDLGQSTEGDVPEMVERLHEHLIACYRANGTVVLFVDEAQNMPLETIENLRMLSNLETSTEKLIQIVLVGQPELDELLARPQLRQLRSRIVVRARLGPLTKADSLAYIRHRLNRVALDDRPIFSEGALALIVKQAAGIPRLINILCDAALITAFGYRLRPIPTKVVREVSRDTFGRPPSRLHPWAIAAVLILALLGGGLGLWKSRSAGHSAANDPIADLIIATERMGAALDKTPSPTKPAPKAAPRPAATDTDRMEELADPAADLVRVVSPLPKPAALDAAPPAVQPPAPPASPASVAVMAPAPVAAPSAAPAPVPPASTALAATASYPAVAAPPAPAPTVSAAPAVVAATPAVRHDPAPPPAPIAAPRPAVQPPANVIAAAEGGAMLAPGSEENRRSVVVKAGDTLSKLSHDVYGLANSDLFGLLQHANPAITDIDRVYVGQVIAFPSLSDAKPGEQEATLRKDQ